MARFSFEYLPKSLARRVEVDLVIPSLGLGPALANKDENYYQNRKEAYPLIIFLHGFGDSKDAWQINTQVISLCEKHGVAACFINGDNKWYLNMGQIDDYNTFIEKDLLDFLYGNFKNLSSDKPLVIAGVSMGGYGSLYHYLNNTDKYAACVSLSPATKPDMFKEEDYGLRKYFLANKDKKLNIYLSVGTKDFIIDACKSLDNFLKENNIDCAYRYVEDADHSWTTWSKEIFEVFKYLNEKGIIG